MFVALKLFYKTMEVTQLNSNLLEVIVCWIYAKCFLSKLNSNIKKIVASTKQYELRQTLYSAGQNQKRKKHDWSYFSDGVISKSYTSFSI